MRARHALRDTRPQESRLPPLINGEPLEVEGTLPLGMIEFPKFSVVNFSVSGSDRLLLVSDRVVEATNSKGHLFRFERLQALLKNRGTAADIANGVGRFGQEDDVSVISVTLVAEQETALAQSLEQASLLSESG